jgi:putative ABC transport system substrate-binding protein
MSYILNKLGQISLLICVMFLIAIMIVSCVSKEDKRQSTATPVRVAVFQIVDYELIANMRRAFAEEMLKSNLAKTRKIEILDYKDAHNDVNLANQIADQLIANKPDLIYVLGTPAAQSLVQRTTTIPIVQGAVTDPIAAKMAASWEGSGRNYAASTDYPPVEAQFKMLMRILPKVKNVGVVYSSGESNSIALLTRVRPVCEKLGLKLIERPVTGTSEVSNSTTALIGKVDAIYIPTDNTVINALPSLLQIAKDNKLPVMASTKEDVQKGALLALGASYEELARIAARISERILSGENPAKIPIAFIEKPDLYWNQGVAEELGIKLSDELNKQIKTTFKAGKEISK